MQQEQTTLQNEVNQQTQSNASSVNGNNGILAQLQALSDAGAQDPVLAVAQWVVTLLFFFIEILPVMVKFLLNLGPAVAVRGRAEERRGLDNRHDEDLAGNQAPGHRA